MSNTIFQFISGVGVFLFAILTIDNAVNVDTKIPSKIEKKINIPIISALCGLISAMITQSSSAINSILAALRDKDLIEEKTSYYAVAGSNIGTTITAYFAVMQSVSLASFFSCLIFFSVIAIMLIKDKKISKIAFIIAGFSLVFVSFRLISGNIPEIVKLLDLRFLTAKNPFIPFGICLLVTAVCQSSSLVSVIIITFSKLGILPLTNAIFMIMAANIGTCSTVFIVSLGKSKKGLKVALFNLIFNVVGVLVCLVMHYSNMLQWFYQLSVSDDTKIAIFHTFFNVICCLAVCPFIGWKTDKIKKYRPIRKKNKTVKMIT